MPTVAEKRTRIRNALNNPYVRAVLDMLAEAEVGTSTAQSATGGYNTLFSGRTFGSWNTHPNVLGAFTGRDGRRYQSSAAGRYQILYSTYNDLRKRYGFNDFTPQTQDEMAIALMLDTGALDDIEKGNIEAALPKLGKRWAAVTGSTLGRNMHSPRPRDFILNAYSRALRKHANGAQVRYPEMPSGSSGPGTGTTTDGGMYPTSGSIGGIEIPQIDVSTAPQLDWSRFAQQHLGARFGNRVLLATRPGDLDEASGTVLSMALANPRSGMPYTVAPTGHIDETTLVIGRNGDRSSDGIRRVTVPATPAPTVAPGVVPPYTGDVPRGADFGSASGGVSFPLAPPDYSSQNGGIQGRNIPVSPSPYGSASGGVEFPLAPPVYTPSGGIVGIDIPQTPGPEYGSASGGVEFPLAPPDPSGQNGGIQGRPLVDPVTAALNEARRTTTIAAVDPDVYLAGQLINQPLSDDILGVNVLASPFTPSLLDLIEKTPVDMSQVTATV